MTHEQSVEKLVRIAKAVLTKYGFEPGLVEAVEVDSFRGRETLILVRGTHVGTVLEHMGTELDMELLLAAMLRCPYYTPAQMQALLRLRHHPDDPMEWRAAAAIWLPEGTHVIGGAPVASYEFGRAGILVPELLDKSWRAVTVSETYTDVMVAPAPTTIRVWSKLVWGIERLNDAEFIDEWVEDPTVSPDYSEWIGDELHQARQQRVWRYEFV